MLHPNDFTNHKKPINNRNTINNSQKLCPAETKWNKIQPKHTIKHNSIRKYSIKENGVYFGMFC